MLKKIIKVVETGVKHFEDLHLGDIFTIERASSNSKWKDQIVMVVDYREIVDKDAAVETPEIVMFGKVINSDGSLSEGSNFLHPNKSELIKVLKRVTDYDISNLKEVVAELKKNQERMGNLRNVIKDKNIDVHNYLYYNPYKDITNITVHKQYGGCLEDLLPGLIDLHNNGRLKGLSLYGTKVNNSDTINKIFKLSNLKSLVMQEMDMTDIPIHTFTFDRLHSLTYLALINNNLRSLPDISSLKKLERLNLKGNQLSKFPKGINSLRKLWLLDISNNQLNKIPVEILSKLTSLRTLLMEHNEIRQHLGSRNVSYLVNNIRQLHLSKGNNFSFSDDASKHRFAYAHYDTLLENNNRGFTDTGPFGEN